MFTKSLTTVVVLACIVGSAAADIVCPDFSYCVATFGSKDRITIAPNGAGETFQSAGITIQVYLRNCAGLPLVGVPRQQVVLYNPALCLCPGGNIADAATDVNGMTTFTGTISGGGCVESLQVYADGIFVGLLAVKTNSPDIIPASPCFVDESDLAALVSRFADPAAYSICYDYNESGPSTIDAADLASFAAFLNAGSCQ